MSEHFLNVARSESGASWIDRLDPQAARTATAITQRTGMSDILARIIAARGVGIEDAEAFLEPTLRALMPDPSSLTDMDKAAERITRAILSGEQIALFGDYDVDGASSVALMDRFLRGLGLDPIVHIPDRIFEGYGPNVAAMDKFSEQGCSLIITLDCGTTSNQVIAHAMENGADVVVIDHHIADHDLPEADALVNPNRPDDVSGLGYLCAAGVTFMTLVAVNRDLRHAGQKGLPDLMGMIDLAALATICDVVPLVGLNRAFVQRGLEIMRKGLNPGISALSLAARITGPINPYHLGFLIGPRINAGGRIGDAGLGARLLSGVDEHETLIIAEKLDELNAERQRIERQAVEEAIAAADAEIGDGEGPAVLVLASADWHAGIVGLVASRVKDRFNRPVFAISLGADGRGTGSGRSIPGVDLGRAVISAVDEGILIKGGGHAMAAGLTVKAANLGALRGYLEDRLGEAVFALKDKREIKIDAAMTARGASADFVEEIERAGPFGTGNPTPVFAFPAHRIRYPEIVGEGGHVRFSLHSDDGAKIKGIAFRAASTPVGQLLLDARDGRAVHVCGSLGIDYWQGRKQVQLRLIDASQP